VRFAEALVGGDGDAGLFLAFGEDLKQQVSAAFVEFHISQFVDAEQIDAAVAGDGLVERQFVGGLDEFVDELGGQDVFDSVAGHGCFRAQRDEQVGLAGA
jgi:hypothetical protein